jgi:hypothetical protein
MQGSSRSVLFIFRLDSKEVLLMALTEPVEISLLTACGFFFLIPTECAAFHRVCLSPVRP